MTRICEAIIGNYIDITHLLIGNNKFITAKLINMGRSVLINMGRSMVTEINLGQ